MKFLIILAASAIASVHCEDVYKTKFDNIDIDTILTNERLLQNHFGCILEGKSCTPETEELKKHIPEILETCCAKCTEKHKEGAKKMTMYLIEKKPEIVKKLVDKYDPDRKYIEKCAGQLTAAGVDISKLM